MFIKMDIEARSIASIIYSSTCDVYDSTMIYNVERLYIGCMIYCHIFFNKSFATYTIKFTTYCFINRGGAYMDFVMPAT